MKIIGATEADQALRVPTVSFVIDGSSSREVVEQVDPIGIGIRYGDFYSRKLVDDLELPNGDGVIRVSAVHYNTIQEIDRLIDVLENLR